MLIRQQGFLYVYPKNEAEWRIIRVEGRMWVIIVSSQKITGSDFLEISFSDGKSLSLREGKR